MLGPAIREAVENELDRSARRVNAARVAFAFLLLLWGGWSGYVDDSPPAGGLIVSIRIAYVVIALGLLLESRRSPAVLRWSWLALPALDVPVVFLTQLLSLELSHAPVARAEMVASHFMFLLLVSQLAMREWLAVAVAATGAACQVVLLSVAGFPSMWSRLIMLPLYFGVAGAVGVYLPHRMRRLIGRAVEDEVARARLAHHFSPAVADHVLASRADDDEGEERRITVVFVVLRGFAALADRLDGPSAVQLLNDFYRAMVAVVFRHGGTLDRLSGGGLTACFNAPFEQPEHARSGVACALEMVEALAPINSDRAARGEAPVRIGVGVHTGHAIVGHVGPAGRREYTAIGGTVDLAASIEALTSSRGPSVLVSAVTRAEAQGDYDWSPATAVEMRGAREPMMTYSPRRRR
jgi:adenylate cyclase